MREIKFRAWDILNSRMIYHSSVSSFPEIMTWDGINYRNGEVMGWILLQYTGLKDKNGTEIYEGDVIMGEDNEALPITFVEGCFGFENDGEFFDLRHGTRYFEVIGNIYENAG